MRLKTYLGMHGLSVAAFGRKIGIETRSTVTRYVTGERLPGFGDIDRIRKATGGDVTADDLVDECLDYMNAKARRPHAG